MNFYFGAASVLDRLDSKKGSIKGIIGTLPDKDRKRTAALVIETLKYKEVLSDVIKSSELMKEKKLASRNLSLVLVHDLLFARGIQAGDGPIKQAVLRHKARLNAELQKVKIKKGVRTSVELAVPGDPRAALIPRHVRINTLAWDTNEAVEWFTSQKYELSDPFSSSKGFARDAHITDLLSFSPRAALTEDPNYKCGNMIIQDKASCIPATVLAPPARDSTCCIDATAAPGNKTSQLSALMQNKGKIFAFERDTHRFTTLKTMLKKAQCRNVEAQNVDFLTIRPSDPQYSGVTHILLDPSCSGSGIVNRLDYLVETDENDGAGHDDRHSKLAAFQLSMIRHAMTFPNASKIVYSTCSVHAIENEHVVCKALATEEAVSGGFALAPRDIVLPAWPRRGLQSEMQDEVDASSLVRCAPGEDGTLGFFVACFMKRSAVPLEQFTRKRTKGKEDESRGSRKSKKRKVR